MKLSDFMKVVDPSIKIRLDNVNHHESEPIAVFNKQAFDLDDIWSYKKYYGEKTVTNVTTIEGKVNENALLIRIV